MTFGPVLIAKNNGGTYGGGILVENSNSVDLKNVFFSNNSAYAGDALFSRNSEIFFDSCQIGTTVTVDFGFFPSKKVTNSFLYRKCLQPQWSSNICKFY